jgi:hypothetical protein
MLLLAARSQQPLRISRPLLRLDPAAALPLRSISWRQVGARASLCNSIASHFVFDHIKPSELHDILTCNAVRSHEAILTFWKQVETRAATACHTTCSLGASDTTEATTVKGIQAELVEWLNQQPPASAYATVIWPRRSCPWAVSARHLRSNLIDNLYAIAIHCSHLNAVAHPRTLICQPQSLLHQ